MTNTTLFYYLFDYQEKSVRSGRRKSTEKIRPFSTTSTGTYPPYPRRQSMRGGLSVVNIEHDNGYDDTQTHENHCKQEIFSKEGHCQRGGWHNFRYKEEKHGLGEENGDAESDFFS